MMVVRKRFAWVVAPLLVGGAALFTVYAAAPPPAENPTAKPGWTLTFQDEFDGKTLDLKKWNPRDPWEKVRNNELQAYMPDAFEVRDGVLRIKAEKRQGNYAGKTREYRSGMMTTYKKFTQQYGWFELRGRAPQGKGLWPAFWLLPDPLGWPPEIDVLEILGHQPTTAYFTHHWRDKDRKHRSDGGKTVGPDFTKDFHVFAVEWRPDLIIWRVDGKETFRSAKSVPEAKMYLLANLAVGGDWPGAPTADTPFPSAFEIDYVRVYTKAK